MPEERRNLKGVMLKSAHKRVNFVRDIDCRIWEVPCMYRELQRMVEIFIGIIRVCQVKCVINLWKQ